MLNFSTISSIIIVGVPREAYYYGLEMLFMPFGQIAGFACFYFFYLPVFYELKYISYFEVCKLLFFRIDFPFYRHSCPKIFIILTKYF